MLELQLGLLTMWWSASDQIRERLANARDDERGEITATTAIIVILVIAAIGAGGVIAAKIAANANNVPTP
jgi:beta-lactamase regulating signal transducer with metallopeptidase domain